jgi:hypothetical protein
MNWRNATVVVAVLSAGLNVWQYGHGKAIREKWMMAEILRAEAEIQSKCALPFQPFAVGGAAGVLDTRTANAYFFGGGKIAKLNFLSGQLHVVPLQNTSVEAGRKDSGDYSDLIPTKHGFHPND